MLLRFGSARAQSPKHPCEDRLARVGGILVNGDNTPIKDLPKGERLEAEESGDIWVRSTDGRGVLFVVADGVGGAPRGGDTSQLVVDRLAELARAAVPVSVRDIIALLEAINTEAHGWGFMEGTDRPLAGAAMTLGWFSPGEDMHLMHAGDTAALRLRSTEVQKLTAASAGGRALGTYVGMGPGFHVTHAKHAFTSDDVLCLVTDGVFKGTSTAKLAAASRPHIAEDRLDSRPPRFGMRPCAGAPRMTLP